MNQLRDARIVVNWRINKIYNRLLQELFPSFLPLSEQLPKVVTPPRARPVKIEDDETVAYKTERRWRYNGRRRILLRWSTNQHEFIVSSRASRGDCPTIPPIKIWKRYRITTSRPFRDAGQCPHVTLTLEGKVIYEPCCGNGAIVRYLEKKGFTVISRDLYTTELKQDYLVEEDPEYDVLITNPPFCVKHQFFEKAMLSSKPFIMLLPLSFLIAKCSYENIKKCLIDIIIMNPSPSFLNGDVERHVGECGWFIVNLTEGGRFTVERLPDI